MSACGLRRLDSAAGVTPGPSAVGRFGAVASIDHLTASIEHCIAEGRAQRRESALASVDAAARIFLAIKPRG